MVYDDIGRCPKVADRIDPRYEKSDDFYPHPKSNLNLSNFIIIFTLAFPKPAPPGRVGKNYLAPGAHSLG